VHKVHEVCGSLPTRCTANNPLDAAKDFFGFVHAVAHVDVEQSVSVFFQEIQGLPSGFGVAEIYGYSHVTSAANWENSLNAKYKL
jgi:hypothetical protein